MADHTVTVESTLEALLVEKKYSTIRDILSTMNPADIASVFDGLEESRLPLLFRLLPKELAAETFVEMEPDAQERLRDVRAAERAHVAGLAAARGIKDCAVQLHEPAVFTLLAGEHARLQPPGVRVRFIDADRVQGFPLRFSVFLLFYHKITKNKRDFSAVSLDKRAARQYDKR